ncbi:transaldolase family protein [Holdemania massiliensis]|uniref:Transaldolase n=1 Tax=Holdemania massiliensis TaxID=1468449 RepID=A0A6N7S374_9FIRM|nr:transaldolase family protein [Holdemania massiliensis]MSA70337.1 transaldolase [Holdemania massiliensis]MSA88132.1 transaldolase [Holdemania massiliensis]MSB76961.1 transaldolase [Holdemania massiliensis]MSC31887.1 transaldolase [Holdemania massiliensis]MSC38207.1 transaldolase [Holdemania massiliensis]
MNKLYETVTLFPQTEVWNDSCSCAELQYAIDNGASGATTNPVIVGNVLKKELPQWEETIKTIITDHPAYTEDEAAWDVIKVLGAKASKLLLPMFEASQGQKGRISFQTNAKYYRSKDKMVEQACELAAVVPNAQIKAPTSKAGVEAFEELTYRGISINATVSFTCAQAIAVAEAVERGLARREAEGLPTAQMHPVCTIMAGRTDDYLKSWVKQHDMLISAEALDMAGVAVVKNAYRLYQERGYRTKLLVAAFRNQHHWEEFIGGDIVLTITSDWQRKYNGSDVEIKSNIDTPVDPKLMAELMKLDEFKKAYLEDGLKPEEFEHYGAFLATMNQFLGGYDDLVKLIRSYMIQ